MKSLQRRFINISERNPLWSSYACFCEAIKGQKFSQKILSYWFGKLVEKDDYDRSDKKDIISHLLVLNIGAEADIKQDKI